MTTTIVKKLNEVEVVVVRHGSAYVTCVRHLRTSPAYVTCVRHLRPSQHLDLANSNTLEYINLEIECAFINNITFYVSLYFLLYFFACCSSLLITQPYAKRTVADGTAFCKFCAWVILWKPLNLKFPLCSRCQTLFWRSVDNCCFSAIFYWKIVICYWLKWPQTLQFQLLQKMSGNV